MERRSLRFHSFDEVLSDADALLGSGYDRGGNWGLAQTCHHLAAGLEMTLDGFPRAMAWPVRVLARWLFLPTILRHGVLRVRLPSPAYLLPPDAPDERGAVEHLRAAAARFEGHSGDMQLSPAFGRLSPQQWRELHLWHCEHHLSFLRPRSVQDEGMGGSGR
jgi:hypothetical protein